LDFAQVRFVASGVKQHHKKNLKNPCRKPFYKTIEKKQNFLTQNPTSFFSKNFCCIFFRVSLHGHSKNTTQILIEKIS